MYKFSPQTSLKSSPPIRVQCQFINVFTCSYFRVYQKLEPAWNIQYLIKNLDRLFYIIFSDAEQCTSLIKPSQDVQEIFANNC